MPKLLLFLPCERIIISQEGTLSLITILDTINIDIPEGEESNLPPDAVIPISWNVVTSWLYEEGDDVRHFQQRVQLILPDGIIPTDVSTLLDLTKPQQQMRNITQVEGFRVSKAGLCELKLFFREVGENNEWHEVAVYPLKVTRPSPNQA